METKGLETQSPKYRPSDEELARLRKDFTYHPPTNDEQVGRFTHIREKAARLAVDLLHCCMRSIKTLEQLNREAEAEAQELREIEDFRAKWRGRFEMAESLAEQAALIDRCIDEWAELKDRDFVFFIHEFIQPMLKEMAES